MCVCWCVCVCVCVCVCGVCVCVEGDRRKVQSVVHKWRPTHQDTSGEVDGGEEED